MLADEYALEGLRKSALRYLSHKLVTIRENSKSKDTPAKLAAENPTLKWWRVVTRFLFFSLSLFLSETSPSRFVVTIRSDIS
jgi:hypothetical protein